MRSHDQGFVGRPPEQVYRMLAEPASYPSWWSTVRSVPGGIQLPLGRRPRPAMAERHRNDVGLHLVSPDGDLEWYLEPFDDGTIVNAFLDVEDVPGRRGERRLHRLRGSIRAGLVGLKRHLEAGG